MFPFWESQKAKGSSVLRWNGMEHWPGHEKQRTADDPKGKKKRRLESSFWQWPHLDHGAIGSVTLVSENGKVKWSSAVDTTHDSRWLPLGRPTKVFPETRPPQLGPQGHSARHRAEKGIQYLRTYFPDVDFPGELLRDSLEADARETRSLKSFDPLLGNMLEIIPCHHTQDEYAVVFPMGELGRELNISRCSLNRSGHTMFNPTGTPSFAFETPILQISSAVASPEWIATPSSSLLIRTHTSSSLVRLERSKLTRELEITRSDTGDAPIVDSRILASGPDIVVVNQDGTVYKCSTQHGKAMQLVGGFEGNNYDHFWQLDITARNDECFLASSQTVKRLDLRTASSVSDIFSLDQSTAVVTSFESPIHDYTSRVTTTSDMIWLDDRFRKRPLLSFKHHRSFDRTLRVLTADFNDASLSLLTSRRNSLVTLYDVSRAPEGLLHCRSTPSCLPHNEPMFMPYDGHALVTSPSNLALAIFNLCQRGSIHQQVIRVAGLDEDQYPSAQETHVIREWDDDVQVLAKRVDQLNIDFGPAAARRYTEVDLRGAYEQLFAITNDPEDNVDQNTFENTLSHLPDVWRDNEEITDSMRTTYDILSNIEDGNNSTLKFFASTNINPKQFFGALMRGQLPTQKLVDLAQWHYNIQDTLVPALNYYSVDCTALNEQLKELNLVSGAERHDPSVQRETEAREQLVLDLALSNDVYSAKQPHSFAAGETTTSTMTRPVGKYSQEPPEIRFGYFRPICKTGAYRYADTDGNGERDVGVSSPLGVRLLLAEWELGTDPSDYTYQDPYGLAEMDEQPEPQYRRLPVTLSSPQRKQMPPRQPPAVVAAATQPPVVHALERAPAESQAVQWTHSQQLEPHLDASSQEPVMSTQVLSGPFGGRLKPARKRIGGF